MKRQFSNFGFSTILIAFVMICIVTFSALSLLTASSDYKLSKKVADKTQSYYEAEETAYQLIAEIDELLCEAYNSSNDKSGYLNKAASAVGTCQTDNIAVCLSGTTTNPSVEFEVPINENQHLAVVLTICYPPDSGGVFYQLTNWQTITDMPQEDNTTLNLIGKGE